LTEDVLLYKDFKGVPFITNGYDYWFLKSTNLKRAAIVTILDYFGAKYTGFDMKDYGPAVVCSIQDVKDVFQCLKKHACREMNLNPQQQETTIIEEEENDDDLVESLKSESEDDLDRYPPNMKKIRGYDSDEGEDEDESESSYESRGEGEDEDEYNYYKEEKAPKRVKWNEDTENNPHCCFDCGYQHPTSDEILDYLAEQNGCSQSVTDKKDDFAIFIFNKEIKIEKSKIRINEDSIVFEEKIPPVNFASCQYDIENMESEIFEKKKSNLTAYANIPPIPYVVHPEGYHLKIELFNNGFVRQKDFKIKRVVLKEEYIQTEPREKTREKAREIEYIYVPEGQKLISDYFKPK